MQVIAGNIKSNFLGKKEMSAGVVNVLWYIITTVMWSATLFHHLMDIAISAITLNISMACDLCSGSIHSMWRRTLDHVTMVIMYHKCPKISYIKVYDKLTYTNNADPVQPTPEGAVWSVSPLFAIPLSSVSFVCHSTKYCKKPLHIKAKI